MWAAIRKAGFAEQGPPEHEVSEVWVEVGPQAHVGFRHRRGPVRSERMPDVPHRGLRSARQLVSALAADRSCAHGRSSEAQDE